MINKIISPVDKLLVKRFVEEKCWAMFEATTIGTIPNLNEELEPCGAYNCYQYPI